MVDKVWKIRNKDGLWSNGGSEPRFSTRGKAWTNLGHLKLHLNGVGHTTYDKTLGRYVTTRLPPEDWEIVEIIIKYDESKRTNVRDMILAQQRKLDLERKFGPAFSELATRIEAKGDQADYQWVLVVGAHRRPEHQKAFTDLLKKNKIKMGEDYRKAVKNDIGAYAFKSKLQAMTVRLAFTGPCSGIDIQQYVETDLDTDNA